MDLSKATDHELANEILSRMNKEPEPPEGCIKVVPAEVPDWMYGEAWKYEDGCNFRGDAAKAFDDNFRWLISRQGVNAARLSIICPTFLRGPLSFNFNAGHKSTLTFGASY
jgi:hypothetical protein